MNRIPHMDGQELIVLVKRVTDAVHKISTALRNIGGDRYFTVKQKALEDFLKIVYMSVITKGIPLLGDATSEVPWCNIIIDVVPGQILVKWTGFPFAVAISNRELIFKNGEKSEFGNIFFVLFSISPETVEDEVFVGEIITATNIEDYVGFSILFAEKTGLFKR